MKFSISTAALVAHILLGQTLAARVVINANNQLQTLERGTPTVKNLEARQVPINPNDTPRGAGPGGSTAPKDMQPKPNEVLPQPTPVVPGSGPPGSGGAPKVPQPKVPLPVNDMPGPVKPPVSGRVRRSSLRESNAGLLRRQSPPLLPPPKNPGGDDPTLPNVIPQPKVPGVPNQPKVPVPIETEKPVPMTFAR